VKFIIDVVAIQGNVILDAMVDQKQIIITGINGFVGGHLTDHLHKLGYLVHGIGREETPNQAIADKIDLYSQADLLDKASLAKLELGDAAAIIHLAGLASVSDSFKYPERYKTDNRTMTDNLLTAAATKGFKGRAVIISTGLVYDATQPMPLSEDSSVLGGSPYAIGKLAAETVSIEHKRTGLDVVIARPFNHIGPDQIIGFLLPDLYQQIMVAKQQNQTSILTGNLTTRRDFTDVRDIVRAYEMLAMAPALQYDVYNVATGKSYSGQEILENLKSVMNSTVETKIDKSKIRPTDANEIIGDASRIRDELGWQPSIPISTTIQEFVASKCKLGT